MSSSMSPARRKRSRPKVPSRTIETLLIPVPLSAGSAGTAPRSGHRTSKRTSSSVNASPVASRDATRPSAASSATQRPVARPGSAHPGFHDS